MHEVNYQLKPIFEIHEFPEHLSAKGHAVAFVQFPEGEKRSRLKSVPFTSRLPGRVLEGQEIILYTPKTVSGGLVGRLGTAISFKRQFKRILRDFKPDVTVVYSVPTSGWQAVQACKESGIPVMFRALDVSHKIRRTGFSPLISLAEKFVYKNADWVSANNPAMKSYCVSMGAKASLTSVELPPLDLNHFETTPDETSRVRSLIQISPDAKVCLYMGSFFYFSGLPELIVTFARLRGAKEHLVLVGGGEQERELKAKVQALKLENFVHFTGFVSYEELPVYLGAADVAVNSMHLLGVSNAAFPNKVLQYMASSLPVVSTRLQGLLDTFEEGRGIQYVSASDDVYQAVQNLYACNDLDRLGELNRIDAASKFSLSVAIQRMEERLMLIAGRKQ